MKKILLLLSAVGMILTACEGGDIDGDNDNSSNGQPGNGNNGPMLEFAEDTDFAPTVPANGETLVLNFFAANSWQAEADVDWITLSQKSGNKGDNIYLTLKIAANNAADERVGEVTVTCGYAIGSIKITQTALLSGITFIDYNVEIICLTNWDTDGDRMINSAEAAAVTSIGTEFKGVEIISFTELQFFTSLTEIEASAFEGCTSLKKITLPNGITSIGSCSFNNCTSLTSVTIPDSVTSIGSSAFSHCTSLTSITIGNGVTSIGESAFYNCTSLSSVTIPDSVTSIGNRAFYECTRLTSVTIPDSVTSIGSSAFSHCESLTSVTIPDSIISIGSSAFLNCTSLSSVTIPDSVTSIGDYAFLNCTSLISVTIPNSVTSIGNRAFYECTRLTSVTIPDSVTSIGESAFYNCTGELLINSKIVENNYKYDNTPSDKGGWLYGAKFTKLTIVDNITQIGSYAFSRCKSLTSVTIPDSIISIGSYAFDYCTSLTRVNIVDLSAWCNIEFGNVYANPLCWAHKLYINGTLIKDLVIPDSVTSIGRSAFTCTSLTSVTIPDSVTSIGGGAFNECTLLTSVTIPDSVTSIGDYAFCFCKSLTSITIGNGVTSIGESAFYNCTSLKEVYCKPTTPPRGGTNMFSYYDSRYYAIGCPIYVPTNSVSAYKSAIYWNYYDFYIKGYNY